MFSAAPFVLALFATQGPSGSSVQHHATVQAKISEMEDVIDEVRSKATRKRLRRKLRALLIEVDHHCGGTTIDINLPPTIPHPPPPDIYPPDVPTTQFPLTDGAFMGLVSAMEGESFPDDRLSLLNTAIATECVNTRQAKELMGKFVHSAPRMKAARLLVPRLTDRGRAFLLLKTVTFRTEKKELNTLINSGPVDSRCWIAH